MMQSVQEGAYAEAAILPLTGCTLRAAKTENYPQIWTTARPFGGPRKLTPDEV